MNEPGAALDLGPENEEQLARLRRALSLEAGFQLVLLEVAQPGLAKEILRRLHRWSGRDGIPALAVVRTRPGRDPVAPLRCIAGGAVLVGIDQPFDLDGIDRELVTVDDSGPDARSDAPARDPVEYTMTTLNWYRDELPSLVAGPLVLVLSPDGLRQLFVHAPDLLAWRAHTTRITAPRPTELEVLPQPNRRASREEKAWLEQMIASSAASAGGGLARELPGWLIRLAAIEARDGGPWEQHLARAEGLAAGRHDLLFKVELTRARRALDEERYEDAWTHAGKAARHATDNQDGPEPRSELMLETLGWGSASRDVWSRIAMNQYAVLMAELLLCTGQVEGAAELAEPALRGARAYGDSALVISALAVAGAISLHRGDRVAASVRFGELQRVARDAGDRAAESFALLRLAELAPGAEGSRQLCLQALSLLEDEDHEARAQAFLGLALHELRSGKLDEAKRNLSRIPLGKLKPKTRIRVLLVRGTASSRRDEALAAYRSAWDEQRTLPPTRTQADLGMIVGSAALHAGDAEIARNAFQRAAEIAEILADDKLAAEARAGLAEVEQVSQATHDGTEPRGRRP